ncbi:alpha/beta hydrolase [Faecalicatena orotica]|uniref:Pimeloyl-ACP methyl ester carboxylesterase n=1 Tax=Faecalicatena orotica TaxID=1544 RepID=A0A2Y9BKJ1_9FIRM|nr:alpha/beta hydrolase [Faecalicatena orotica]PWJ22846.1 pimeloyl-ACP methyl ester carboxylesterase [Faecalicatena orotica]SSA57981.1 Pimeloyl-ACP methyl ester carboxylesterase [Faecalicatena orotica]
MIFSKENFFETSDGAILYYEDYGEGDPIFLLHGFCCSSQVFRNNIEGLKKKHRLILMDLRGHGASSKTLSGVTMPRMAQDVKDLIEYLQLSDVTLLGWSMGGQVALMYWRLFAGYGYVRRMGILDSTLYPFSDGEWNKHGNSNYNMDKANDRLIHMMEDHQADARAMVNGMLVGEVSDEDKAWIQHEIMKTPPYIAYSIYSDFLGRDFTDFIPAVTVPMLFIGSNSPAVKGEIAMDYYVSKCRTDYELVKIGESGHFFFYFQPERFNQIVLEFIEKYPLIKGGE